MEAVVGPSDTWRPPPLPVGPTGRPIRGGEQSCGGADHFPGFYWLPPAGILRGPPRVRRPPSSLWTAELPRFGVGPACLAGNRRSWGDRTAEVAYGGEFGGLTREDISPMLVNFVALLCFWRLSDPAL